MTFKANVDNSTFEAIEVELEKAIFETLRDNFSVVVSGVELKFNVDEPVIVTFKVGGVAEAERLIEVINGEFKEKLNEKMRTDEGILNEVVLDSVSAGTNQNMLIYYGKNT